MNDKKIIDLLNGGIDHYNFKRIVFDKNNTRWLENLSYESLTEITNSIRTNGLATYTLFPFFYKYLGVNLLEHYLVKLQSEWKDCNLCKQISMNFHRYPISLTSKIEVETYLDKFDFSKTKLAETRYRLISQGAIPIEYLDIMGRNIKVKFPY